MAEPFAVVVREGEEADWSVFLALIELCPEAARWADTYPALVAEVEGRVAGFALYRLVAGEGELLNLAVDPELRRGGVGRALIAALMPLAEHWHLEVRAGNTAAIGLYRAFGMEQVGRRERYYSDGEAALLFSGSRRSA